MIIRIPHGRLHIKLLWICFLVELHSIMTNFLDNHFCMVFILYCKCMGNHRLKSFSHYTYQISSSRSIQKLVQSLEDMLSVYYLWKVSSLPEDQVEEGNFVFLYREQSYLEKLNPIYSKWIQQSSFQIRCER